MGNLATIERHGDVALVILDNPPVNAVGPGVPEALCAALRECIEDAEVKAIVLSGAGSTFIAGFDINELRKIAAGQRPDLDLLPFLQQWEDSPKPVVMAIHGAALGGGLEFAMVGHYRVMAADAVVAQPEVKLGVIPGMGGTQRLPRLVGVEKALQMCVSGDSVSAAEALQWGLVDRVVNGNIRDAAISLAREVVGRPGPATRFRRDNLTGSPDLFAAYRERAKALKRLQRAPLAAIEAIEAATQMSFDDGCRTERHLFEECLHGAQAKALIHVFFAEKAATKIKSSGQPLSIRRAAVVGAGTMGAGIAMVFANAGIPVTLRDVSGEAVESGFRKIDSNYEAAVAKRKLSEDEARRRLALIEPQNSWNGFESADIVVEAVFENLAVKQNAVAEISSNTRPDCLLLTNTSTLDVDAIAQAATNPERVAGFHFFSPAQVMRLVEVVRGSRTSDETIATLMSLAKRLGKTAVVAGNSFGFIGNRMMVPYLEQAYRCLEDGASVEQVDSALYEFGMAMGPFAMEDQIGLDITYAIRQEAKHAGLLPLNHRCRADAIFERGHLGQKTGQGWYVYDENRKRKLKEEHAAGTSISDSEIVERCLGALAQEGRKLLSERVAARASDVDVVWVHGYGFPAWRGGPMFWFGHTD